jgi:hypothetical protein
LRSSPVKGALVSKAPKPAAAADARNMARRDEKPAGAPRQPATLITRRVLHPFRTPLGPAARPLLAAVPDSPSSGAWSPLPVSPAQAEALASGGGGGENGGAVANASRNSSTRFVNAGSSRSSSSSSAQGRSSQQTNRGLQRFSLYSGRRRAPSKGLESREAESSETDDSGLDRDGSESSDSEAPPPAPASHTSAQPLTSSLPGQRSYSGRAPSPFAAAAARVTARVFDSWRS